MESTASGHGTELSAVSGTGPPLMRRRNPRGQGHRLRDEVIRAAKELLADSGDPRELSLRSVAKRAGVAAPSIYRHFSDVDGIKIAVVQDCFADLEQARSAASSGLNNPAQALLARARAYCRFALDRPGHYRLMFGPDADLPTALVYDAPDSPGRAVFDSLVASIRACQAAGVADTNTDPAELAVAMWSFEHGLVTLRLSRPHFPWPPLEDILTNTLTHLLSLRGEIR